MCVCVYVPKVFWSQSKCRTELSRLFNKLQIIKWHGQTHKKTPTKPEHILYSSQANRLPKIHLTTKRRRSPTNPLFEKRKRSSLKKKKRQNVDFAIRFMSKAHVIFVAFGSRGDVQPLAVLASELAIRELVEVPYCCFLSGLIFWWLVLLFFFMFLFLLSMLLFFLVGTSLFGFASC